MEEYRIEYRITGRFRMDTKKHIVDSSRKWTKQDAENRLQELTELMSWEIEHKTRKAVGFVACKYYSDYDLLELKIESRKVTKWESEE